jgi:Fe2+ transport system protein FeoA
VAAKSNGVVETGRRPFGAASTKTLDQVVWGRVHVVTSTDGGDALEMRLMELGFVPGAPVAVRGAAPLGDPLEVEIHHVRLSMRRSEARRIRVRDNEG